jgi:hypothetical protein
MTILETTLSQVDLVAAERLVTLGRQVAVPELLIKDTLVDPDKYSQV